MLPDLSTPALPPRDPRGHKGTFGAVAVIGGCAHRPDDRGAAGVYMLGGPALAAAAALRAGAGLARLVLPEPLLAAALAVAPSATGIPLAVDPATGRPVPHLAAPVIDQLLTTCDVLAVGPGLGVSNEAAQIVLRCLGQDVLPVVADADALNNLARTPDFHKDLRAPALLTPHVGEFRRLAAALGITLDPERDPAPAAADLARRLGCIVVLKSSTTIVTDGQRAWTFDHPNPALATAGTGDILAGLIAGLIAQYHKSRILYPPAPGATGRVFETSAAPPPPSSGATGGLPASAPPSTPSPPSHLTPSPHHPITPSSSLSLYDCARAAVAAHSAAAHVWSTKHRSTTGLLAPELLDELPAVIDSLRSPSPFGRG